MKRERVHIYPHFFIFFEKIVYFFKIMCTFAMSTDDNNRITNQIFIHYDTE